MRQATCVDCTSVFPVERDRGVLPHRCDVCRVDHVRKQNREKTYRWRARNPEKVKALNDRFNAKYAADPERLRLRREHAVRKAYGVEPEQITDMLAKQEGRCAICGGPPSGPGTRLHIDHCHSSGKVRGLLCHKCNTMIGLAGDDVGRLKEAIRYLEET